MTENLESKIKKICDRFGRERSSVLDIVREVQSQLGYVPSPAMDLIAQEVSSHRVEIESVVSFYSFLSNEQKGKVVIRLCDDIIDRMQGSEEVAAALTDELGIDFGEMTEDGAISLERTACIGMCDQAPAALVNDVVVTRLSSDSARKMLKELKQHADPSKLTKEFGDGNNANELVRSMVSNNIREKGEVLLADNEAEAGLSNALNMTPAEVIRELKTARLRGRGGAGFPLGMKWEFTRGAEGEEKVVICNADEGEPGTFKDRVLLTECPDLLFEGMTIGGHAIGAKQGILYLRGEYAYLEKFLEDVLEKRREKGLLGTSICQKDGFDFDIKIQMGAGAYICGEETALISSCEGLRGDPKNRPPFPAQKGYQGKPTSVNNVETLCCVSRILHKGAGWFSKIGNGKSSGTKLLSVSGDCQKSGIYEVPFGITLKDLLAKVGGTDAIAVQVGGPSGKMTAPKDFGREICFEDLATGGSIMVFGPNRDVLEVVEAFLDFFVEESCGYCTPCRAGNVILKNYIETIRHGKGETTDLDTLLELAQTVKATSRCGLGQTSPNPVLQTLEDFRPCYDALVKEGAGNGQLAGFKLEEAVEEAEGILGRKSVHV